MSTLEISLNLLSANDPFADLTQELDELLEHASPSDANDATFQAAFQFFERHPTCELGSPGPLVHWLEKAFPLYIEALLDSVNRRPTDHTLWMINRIINANITQQTRQSLLSAIRSASTRTDVEASTAASALEFLQLRGG
jgi:hypothetical protein